jgi:hypothetical protein
VNPRSPLRRPRQERRSVAPSTSGSDLARRAPQRATPGAPLLLYRCNAFGAWLTVSACAAIKLREPPPPRGSRAPENEGPVFAGLRALGRRLSPCAVCPGVVALRERRETPPPRRIAP